MLLARRPGQRRTDRRPAPPASTQRDARLLRRVAVGEHRDQVRAAAVTRPTEWTTHSPVSLHRHPAVLQRPLHRRRPTPPSSDPSISHLPHADGARDTSVSCESAEHRPQQGELIRAPWSGSAPTPSRARGPGQPEPLLEPRPARPRRRSPPTAPSPRRCRCARSWRARAAPAPVRCRDLGRPCWQQGGQDRDFLRCSPRDTCRLLAVVWTARAGRPYI